MTDSHSLRIRCGNLATHLVINLDLGRMAVGLEKATASYETQGHAVRDADGLTFRYRSS